MRDAVKIDCYKNYLKKRVVLDNKPFIIDGAWLIECTGEIYFSMKKENEGSWVNYPLKSIKSNIDKQLKFSI